MQLAQHNRQVMHQLQQQRMLMGGATHPLQMSSGLTLHQPSHMPLVNSSSSGNILHVCLKFSSDMLNIICLFLAVITTC